MPLPPSQDAVRTPYAITLSVWKAIFLREAVTRLSTGRAAWVWLLVQPLFHIGYLLVIYTVINVRVVGGIDTSIWLTSGMLAFFMFQRTATQAQNAISANKALFAYRQVKPVDTVLVRAGLEGFLMMIVAVLVLAAVSLLGHEAMPADPLALLDAFLALWLVGLGFGLIAAVAGELVPEFNIVIGFAMTPLYFLSGVMFPLSSVPTGFRQWLLLNPLAHGLEAVRLGFSPYYYVVPDVSLQYVHGCALALVFFGLLLHQRFATRIMMQ